MKRATTVAGSLAAIAVALALAPPGSAATVDTATATVSNPSARIGEPVTFTAGVCSVNCRLRWVWRNGTRLGVQMGEGHQITYRFSRAGSARVQLDLSQPCQGSGGRLVCHSYAYAYVLIGQARGCPSRHALPRRLSSRTTRRWVLIPTRLAPWRCGRCPSFPCGPIRTYAYA
jgi:hypothetical protein